MSDLDKEYEASLKSIVNRNKIDRIFSRRIGFVLPYVKGYMVLRLYG